MNSSENQSMEVFQGDIIESPQVVRVKGQSRQPMSVKSLMALVSENSKNISSTNDVDESTGGLLDEYIDPTNDEIGEELKSTSKIFPIDDISNDLSSMFGSTLITNNWTSEELNQLVLSQNREINRLERTLADVQRQLSEEIISNRKSSDEFIDELKSELNDSKKQINQLENELRLKTNTVCFAYENK